ncbi:hypothetical protein ACFQY4_18825 [Catellatospora bangladeshensis]|uniref:hypothetical protein n=1 Tax=Catellatospora bangladeshensis TaxID=310355 RepID=UPI00361F24EF
MTGSTATTGGARAHARAQGGTVVACMPTVPATGLAEPPQGSTPPTSSGRRPCPAAGTRTGGWPPGPRCG